MFSAAAHDSGPAKGTRSSRRRQRPTSSDSLAQQPKAKRQRVPLSESTFVNPDAAPEMFEVKSDKIDLLGIKRDGLENFGTPRKELSVRSKKPKPGERVSKGDGSVVLTTNSAYTVSKLPALPDRIRANWEKRQHGAINGSSGYALTLSHTHALVWPYTSSNPSPETFVFSLPYPSKHDSDPLPLGSLVSPSAASDEPGLVVVMPISGKVVFWESISSAATLDFLREQRNGVEDSIHGMFSGEHVTQIVTADSVGFILVFSSGRLAYMNVRDGHGRPAISVQFLRNSPSNGSGGFFGSLRNALSTSAIRGDVVAVRAGPSVQVGERFIVAATAKGKLHSWKIHRGGHHESGAELDIRERLINAIKLADPLVNDASDEHFEVVDFTYVPRSSEKKYADISRLSDALTLQDDSVQHLLLLAAFNKKTQARYSLVEAVFSGGNCDIGMVRPLKTYKSPFSVTSSERPRVHLPRPGLVAFVVYERAVVIASLTAGPDSPDAQLQEEGLASSSFEDVVDFQEANRVEIIGSGSEEPTNTIAGPDELRNHRHHHKTKNPAATLLVHGVGVVRVALTDIDRFATGQPPQVTAKSKLEQAVFFGIKNDNPLAFQGQRVLPFSDKEIGNAAVEMSHEIVASKTPFMPNIPASLESNMRTRLSYLDRLISHLHVLGTQLDERTKWMLLYNAEKMFVAIWIWQKTEEFLQQRPKSTAFKNLVGEITVAINREHKTEPRLEIGEVDPVRHWFLNDVWRMETFIAWCYEIVKITWGENTTDEVGLNRLVWEALVIMTGSMREAFQYRKLHYELYGLREPVNSGGDAIPRPWTSSSNILSRMKRLFDLSQKFLSTFYEEDKASLNNQIVQDVRAMHSVLAGHYLRVLEEYLHWAKNSDESTSKDYLYASNAFSKVDDVLLALINFDLSDEAIELAKEHKCWKALAEILAKQIDLAEKNADLKTITVTQSREFRLTAEAKRKELGDLMNRYGEEFASHAYTQLLEVRGIQDVLEFPYGKKSFRTTFLRNRPELAKISWINDVEAEKDIEQAADTLLDLGMSREQQVWSKKIELSLGKLALLAQESTAEAPREDRRPSRRDAKNGNKLEQIDQELGIIKIQDSVYNRIYPSTLHAVDLAAAKELALENHTGPLALEQPALKQIFDDAMGRLIKHEALTPMTLIDLLTLALLPEDYEDEIGDQFFLALQVARLGLKGQARTDAQRLIWRRCYIRDDWKVVNETNARIDTEQMALVTQTTAFKTFFAVARDNMNETIAEPKDARGVFIENLDARFDAFSEDLRSGILEAMKWEDKKLDLYIRKHQLQTKWFGPVLTEAKNAVARALEEASEPETKTLAGDAKEPYGDARRHETIRGLFDRTGEEEVGVPGERRTGRGLFDSTNPRSLFDGPTA